MGHACVVFNDKLWVLGGNDETGTSVNEVWTATLNGEQLVWEQKSGDKLWQPRCMFAATASDVKLWLYGGLTEPFSDPLEDLWFLDNGETWQQYTAIPKENNNPVGKPIGATLQVVNNQLSLFGSFRSGNRFACQNRRRRCRPQSGYCHSHVGSLTFCLDDRS